MRTLLTCIGQNWTRVCEEAALSEADGNLLWGRQFLNPYAFTALEGRAAGLKRLGDEIRGSAG
jgi:serine/threonine-protein kinase HipA